MLSHSLVSLIQIATILFILVATLFYLYINILRKKEIIDVQSGYNYIDIINITLICSLFAAIAYINIGNKTVKNSAWYGSYPNKYFEIKLNKPTKLSAVYYYTGLSDGSPVISLIKRDGSSLKIVDTATIPGQRLKQYLWLAVNIPESAEEISSVRFTTVRPIVIKQVALINLNKSIFLNYKLIGDFDKSDNLNNFTPTVLNINEPLQFIKDSCVGDELYYAPTAYQISTSLSPIIVREHPPLALNLIALSIKCFGMSPFAWRLVSYLSGIILVMLMYLMAKKITGSRKLALFSAVLISLDFMHFVFGRMAAIESVLVVFFSLSLFFLYLYNISCYNKHYYNGMKYLIFSGIACGLAISTKWSGLFLYPIFMIIILHSWVRQTGRFETKLVSRKFFLKIMVMVFVIIPSCIYALNYIPEFLISKSPNFLSFIIDESIYAWHFQTRVVLDAKHFYASPWWSWPLILKPLAIYRVTDFVHKQSTAIVLMGNPAIWWVGTICVFILFLKNLIIKYDKNSSFILLCILMMLLPYAFFKRYTFIYYFYATVPWFILAIVQVAQMIQRRSQFLAVLISSLLLCYAVLLFILFYPVLTATAVKLGYTYKYLHWFSTWVF